MPLETLRLSETKVQILEPEIGNLANLAELDVSHTAISNLPLEIGKLTNLQQLKLEVIYWENGRLGMADIRRTYSGYTADIRQPYGEHMPNMRQKWLRTYG